MNNVEINRQTQIDNFVDQFSAKMGNNTLIPIKKTAILLTGNITNLGYHLLKYLVGFLNITLVIYLKNT